MTGQAISDWFKGLVESAAKPTFELLSATVLGTPSITSDSMARIRELWTTSQWIANTCFVLLVAIAGVLMMVGHSLPNEISVKEVLPRLVWAFLASNLSLTLIGYAITFANGLTDAFLTSGAERIDPAEAGRTLASGVEVTLATDHIFYVLVALVAVVLALIVAFIYVVRLAITLVLIAAAPLALMLHALQVTDGIARLWWRGLTGMLAIQTLQALVLVSALRVLFAKSDSNAPFLGIPTSHRDSVDLLLVICLLWIMIKIPSWVARTIWQQAQPRMATQLVKSIVMYHTVGRLLGGARGRGKGTAATKNGPKRGPQGGPRRGPQVGPPGGQGPRPGGGQGTGARPSGPTAGGHAAQTETARQQPKRDQQEARRGNEDRQRDRASRAQRASHSTEHRRTPPQPGIFTSRMAWTARPSAPMPRTATAAPRTGSRPTVSSRPVHRMRRQTDTSQARTPQRVALRLQRSHHYSHRGAR
ncbi:hypothetical protein [Actinomadura rupiterrae]|uniref:hypothetical protein n=1 Tax=Actinomadura rupiterrae TaxID=559627 RepID=UPI0020A457D0|nr:hypothetical protein [Actinomadura rupiterrae]MCP2343717.1 hypothetical protein [Actinomadura rupiterrae]